MQFRTKSLAGAVAACVLALPGAAAASEASELRAEIDRIDRAMHELLIERSGIIDTLIKVKKSNETGSALFCSEASVCWNSGRIASGTSPRSTADSVCPTFMAAPRMPENNFRSASADLSC